MDIDETAVSENGRRKYQVFISSTFRDLVDQRRMVLDVVIDRGHMPIALERFPAADRTVPNVIRKTIDASQIYVVILGYRYGAIVDGQDISFSQLEYEIAVEQGKIVVPFLLVDDEVREQRSMLEARLNELKAEITQIKSGTRLHRQLIAEIDDLRSELKHDSSLSEFRKKVSQGRFCKPFSLKSDTTDYGSGADRFERHMVLKALIEAEEDADKRRVAGWIREPGDKTLSDTLAAVSGNRFLVDVVASMAKFDRLGPRIRDQADEKVAAAQFFADKYLQPLLSKEARLFFESGSSIAYVAQVVGKRLEDHRKEVVISTNNVLAYLIFWLVHRVRCSMFPWGPPEERYGAVFGPVNEYVPETMKPSFPPDELSNDDMEAIRLLQVDPYSPAKWEEPALMLGALSGLQLSPDPAIANCCGPHVGSPRNKVFKRFMYSTGLPVMLFMTANKVDCPVDHEHCHFILEQEDGAGLPWKEFVSNRPIAFCVGCKNDANEIDRIVKQFELFGLHVVRANHRTSHTAFVARNQKFIDVVESGMTITTIASKSP